MVKKRAKKTLPPPQLDDPVEDPTDVRSMRDRQLSRHIWNEATRAADTLFASAVRAFTEARMRQSPSYAKAIMDSHNAISESYGYNWNMIDPKWAALCGAAGRYDGRTRAERLEAEREFSRFLYDYNTTVMGIIETLVTYVCGQELNVSFSLGTTAKPDKEPKIVTKARDKWMSMYRRDGFQFEVRSAEMVRRALRDGESLNHVFLRDKKSTMPNLTEAENKPKEAVWRFGEPEDLKVPLLKRVDKPNIDYGVEYDPKDPETILKYWFEPPGALESLEIPANEIYHVKIGASLNAHRGIPLIRGQLADRCKHYGEWLDTRIFLNKARASIAAVIYRNNAVTNDKSALESVQTGKRIRNLPGGGTKEIQKYILDVATIMFMKQGEKIEFVSPNLGSDEAAKDGRAILCSIAVALGLSDYMVTGDSEYGKYANQEVGESRGVATLVSFQRFFLRHIAWIVKRLVSLELVADGSATESDVEQLEVTILGPRIVPRDVLAWARAQDLRLKNRTISRHQSIRDDGMDPDRIDEEINQDTMEVPSDQLSDPATAGIVQRKNKNNRPKSSPARSPSASGKKS